MPGPQGAPLALDSRSEHRRCLATEASDSSKAGRMEMRPAFLFGMSSAHLGDMTPSKKIDDLYDLIEGIETAMFTTRRPNGQLASRPMATQHRIEGADLWFVTNVETHKLDELALDPHVNCAYYNNRTHEWVSVSGVAHVSKNRNRIRQLYQEEWKDWLGDEGGDRDGGPPDSRIALIPVDADYPCYLQGNKARPIILLHTLT